VLLSDFFEIIVGELCVGGRGFVSLLLSDKLSITFSIFLLYQRLSAVCKLSFLPLFLTRFLLSGFLSPFYSSLLFLSR